jgi:glycine/D-amino acid oxidase-like deaminating enzyme
MALQLLYRDKKILVYDQPQQNKSSSVAAGLFNPITGKVMVRTWKSEILFPSLHNFYKEAEKFLASKFFYPMPLYRPFNTVFEQNEWMAQSANVSFKEYIDMISVRSAFGDEVVDPFGGMLLKQCGYLDVPLFVDAVRGCLVNKQAYYEEVFDSDSIVVTDDGFTYKNTTTAKIIFCGGMHDQATNYFSWLPLRSLKGETLQIKVDVPLNRMYNKGLYIAPHSKLGHYKVGATYDPQDKTTTITENARVELKSKLNELLTNPYQLVAQEWGFRPCAHDRKPYVGQHPNIKNMYVLNGFGTKGVSLAPFFSNQLAEYMEGKDVIDAEASIARLKEKK